MKTVVKKEFLPVEDIDTASTSATFRIPKFRFPREFTHTHLLVGLLVVFSFALGYLYNQVQYLEKNAKLVQVANAQAQAAAPQNQAAAPVTPPQKVNVDVGHFPVKGDANAKVTLVEFADLRCPFCEKFFTDTEPQILKDYVDTGKVKFAFRSYAFLGPASTLASNAVECANDQGKFWDMHDYLYKNQPSETDTSMYTTDNLTTIAGQLGMDTTLFSGCLSNTKDSKSFQDDMSAASAAGVTGTPTVFINGTPVVGAEPYSTFKTAIDAALQG